MPGQEQGGAPLGKSQPFLVEKYGCLPRALRTAGIVLFLDNVGGAGGGVGRGVLEPESSVCRPHLGPCVRELALGQAEVGKKGHRQWLSSHPPRVAWGSEVAEASPGQAG